MFAIPSHRIHKWRQAESHLSYEPFIQVLTKGLNVEAMYPVPNPVESYWLRDRHPLNEVRTTPHLPAECDVVIIGSGMAGVSTAYYLLLNNPRPPRITILEARQLCSGATGRNGGHCKIKTMTLASLIPKLGLVAVDDVQAYVHGIMDSFKLIVEEEMLDCEFELRRSFDVQTNSEDSARLKKIYDESRKVGSKWTVNTSFIDERYAEQVTSIQGATSAFSVPACSLWPYKFVTQLLARLLDRHPEHVNVQTKTLVEAITLQADASNLVKTPRGTIKCAKVIFATNAYTSGLLPQFKDTIIPTRGIAAHIVPKSPIQPHLTHTYNINFGPDKGVDYLNPRPDGGIVVGGGKWMYKSNLDLWLNNWDDSVPFNTAIQSYWENYMQRTFHGWENSGAGVDKTWVGIMGITPDEWPHVGRIPGTRTQFLLAGFNGGGMAMILTASKAIARMVRDDVDFETLAEELGIPAFFGTSLERLKKEAAEDALAERK